MNTSWAQDAIFYHIYPLGLCGAPEQNNFTSPPKARIRNIHHWVDHIRELGCNALYLGPVFESGTHGYDTADYFSVDRRLGSNQDLKEIIAHFHEKGIRVILDGVFNHVGRDFWAFKDLQQHGSQSAYCNWFSGLDFNRRSPYGDPFTYDGWNGHHSLVKLNLHNQDVRAHLFAAVKMWKEEFGIDGLRLDAADVMDLDFLGALSNFCHQLQPDFWLMGEVIHGDYGRWLNAGGLDSVTNYECYKGLYSSHNDRNYFEIAHSLQRLFGEQGIYRGQTLYSFADNHDVNRIASCLQNPVHLYPLYALLFTMPGIPSVYYGSEWGISGRKKANSDAPLRPMLSGPEAGSQMPHPELAKAIQRFVKIRKEQPALREGDYRQLFVAPEQFTFARRSRNNHIVVAANAAGAPASFSFPVDMPDHYTLIDLLEPKKQFRVQQKQLKLDVPSNWARVLLVQ